MDRHALCGLSECILMEREWDSRLPDGENGTVAFLMEREWDSRLPDGENGTVAFLMERMEQSPS